MSTSSPHVAIVGGGPAGLMAAQALLRGGARVTVIERMPSPARKFLMAGRGGLNLTHAEPFETFLTRYGNDVDPRLLAAIRAFPPKGQIKWAEGLGQKTFIGTSGRVFPKAMKASPLLRAWLARLASSGLVVETRTRWVGFGPTTGKDIGLQLRRDGDAAPHERRFDAIVLALGGASWPRLGADGSWVDLLSASGVDVAPLSPANVGIKVPWSAHLSDKHAGHPLKRIALTVGGQTLRGEAIITRGGLEGGVVYAATEAIRQGLVAGDTRLMVDLKPDQSSSDLAAALAGASLKDSTSSRLRKALSLSPAAVALLQEVARPLPRDAEALARLVKALPLVATGFTGLERAISSAGGVTFSSLDDGWMLRALPGVFVSGEMLDWTAPTGGYLLTACLATGRAAGEAALAWLERQRPSSDA